MRKAAEKSKQRSQKGYKAMIEVKKNCFAYSTERKKCEVLAWTYCVFEEKCAFYKTKEQVEKERKGKKYE